MNKKLGALIFACTYLGLILFVASPWHAQGEDEEDENKPPSATVFVEIPSFLTLTVADGLFFLDMGASTGGQDIESSDVSRLKVISNSTHGWTLFMWTDSADLGPINQPDADLRKSVSDVTWRTSGGKSGQLTHQRQEIATTRKTGEVDLNLDYLIDIRESDPPGQYGLKLKFLAVVNEP